MSKKKGVPGYPAERLEYRDLVSYKGHTWLVIGYSQNYAYLRDRIDGLSECVVAPSLTCLIRLIRKANGPTYETWQRRTSKLLKAMGLSRWPGAVMHEYFFNSVSPEEAAAGFLADHFLINEQ
jgi:hypothetical protein